MGRVSERCCHRSLPSEPDVKVSLHPAQADAKPRRNGTGATTVIAPCHLYDTGMQPSGLAFTLGPVGLVSVRCLPEDAHMDKSTFICFSSNERFYRFSRNDRPCWKSACLRSRVETATPIPPITGGLLLSPAFLCSSPHQRSLRSRLPPRGRVPGLPCSAFDTGGFRSTLYTGRTKVRVG
jgi:hypothetical protein